MRSNPKSQQEGNPIARLLERDLDRRRFLGGAAFLAMSGLSLPAILEACGSSSPTTTASTLPPDTLALFQKLFPGSASQQGQGKTLQVGMNLAMTGSGSFYGKVMSSGAELAAGQILGYNGANLNITINDHLGDTQTSVTGVQRLITQNSIKVLETSYAAPSEALIPMIHQHNILMFNGGGASPGQLSQDYVYVDRMLLGWDPMPGALSWLNANFPSVKNIAVIGTKENGVEAYTQKLPVQWPKLVPGGKIVDTEVHDVGATDFSSAIARIKSHSPDAIYSFSFGTDLGYQIKQLRQANFAGPILGCEYTTDAYAIAGSAMDQGYFFAYDYFDTNGPSPLTQQFVKAYKAKYGVLPEFYGANYYEITLIVFELVRRVLNNGGDPTSGQQLQAALKAKPTFYSVYGGDASNTGTLSFDLTDHTVSKPMGVFQVQSGVVSLLQYITKIGLNDDPKTALSGSPVKAPSWKPSS